MEVNGQLCAPGALSPGKVVGWAPRVGLNAYQVKKKSLRVYIFVSLIFILVYLYHIRVHGVQEVTIPTYMIGYIIFMTLLAGILNSVW